MKTKMKVLMSVVCMCLTISVVYAEEERVQLNIWGGYKSISMSTFNQALDNTAAFLKASGYTNVSTQKAQGGVLCGVEIYR